MKKHRSPWSAVLAIFICLFLFGIGSIATIVSQEGLDGLFKRKRTAVKKVMPEALPIADKVEEKVRSFE